MSILFLKWGIKMFTLNSKRLRVEISEPGENPNISLRFDRAGYISDVVLDGGYHFCASEPRNLCHPTSMGRGLCNEWCLDVSSEAKIGEYFPKFGVGLIRKEEDFKYVFHKAYKDVVPFPVRYEHTNDTAVFVTEAVPCLGYALKHTKTISVQDETITMIIKAENVGEKPMEMREFCHNFLSIDGMAVGSDYHLSMPAIPEQPPVRLLNRNGKSSSFRGEGRGLTFCEFSAIDTDIAFNQDVIEPAIPFTWELRHDGAQMWVRGEDYYHPFRVPVWAVDHIVAPEVNHTFTLNPGESHEWKRTWTFGTDF